MDAADLKKHVGTNKLAIGIALKGGRVAPGQFFGNWTWYCDNPIELKRRVTARHKEAARAGSRIVKLVPMDVAAMVPCRKCAKCLQYRQMKWRNRAITEVTRAKRTWFVTLTFDPVHLAGILIEANGAGDKEVEGSAYRHVQRYIKRLRKVHTFRYLAVYERGEKTGRSHYHLLLHELDKPITKRVIERQWRSNVHARLVSSDGSCGSASYITKYATKSFDIRPRASTGYGKIPSLPKPKVLGENLF